MKLLFKSFFKFNFVKTIQTISFIIFIFLFSGITIGLTTTPIQIINIANTINKQENKWDYSWETYWDIYNNEFLYKYFENNTGQDNFLKQTLLNLNLNVEDQTLDSYLKKYYSLNLDKYKNYEDFIGSFIKNNVFSFKYLYDHQVLLPPLKSQDTLVNFADLVNNKWLGVSYLNYGQVYNLINQDLNNFLKINGPQIETNFIFSYTWADYGGQRTKFNLEPINFNQSDNVVLLKGDKAALLNMKDDEIIINDKYAKLHNLKIGDYLKINNYVNKDNTPLSFSKYKIIGFGTKINNLFSNDLLNSSYNTEVYCYLTDNEMIKYIKYLYQNDNMVIYPDKKSEYQNQVFIKTRLIGSNSTINKFADSLKKENVLNKSIDLKKYNQESFSQTLTFYIIEAAIFIIIGIILLICAIFFINYCLKKELEYIATTIGILKANGYYGIEMTLIFWLRILIMLLIGFAIGFVISLPVQTFVYEIIMMNSFVLVSKILLNWLFIISALLLMPIVLSLINFGYLMFYLKISPVELVNGKKIRLKMPLKIKKQRKSWHPLKSFLFLKSLKKTNIILVIISLSFVTFCFEINSKQLMTNLTDQWTPVYQGIDSSFNLDYKFNWKKDNNKFTFDELKQYNIDFDYYHQNEPDYINQQIDLIIQNALINYLKAQDKVTINEELHNILDKDFNKKTIKLSVLEEFMKKIVIDYYADKIELPIEEIIKEIEANWIPQFDNLNKKITNKDITFTFNKMFIKNDDDFPTYNIDLTTDSYNYKSSNNWKFILLNNHNWKAFKWNGITSEILNNWKTTAVHDSYPVLVTQHFAKLNNLKIGDTFIASLAKSHDDSSLKMIIKGINSSDIYTNNIYGYYDLFINDYTNLDINSLNLYNEVLTRQQALIYNKNLSNFTINSNYFSFFIPNENNDPIYLSDLIGSSKSKQMYDFITWNSFGSKTYSNYALQTTIANDKNQNFNNLMNFIAISTILILTILYLVLNLITFLDGKQFLAVLKALGASNWLLLLNLSFKTFFGIIFACILGVIFNYFVWDIIMKVLFKNVQLIVLSPFNWFVILIGIMIIFIIFILGIVVYKLLLKKMRIT